jgi:hypothetical protein
MRSCFYGILATLLALSSLFVSVPATAAVGPPSLAPLTLNPTTVTGGASTAGTVILTGRAPIGGAVVHLSSGNLAVARILIPHLPPLVAKKEVILMVPAGQNSVNFTVMTKPVTSQTSVAIVASYGGLTKTATLAVLPPALSSLTCTPTSVTVGHDVACTVALTGLVASGGQVVVGLQSSNPNVAEPPNQAYVPETQNSAQFTVRTKLSSSSVAISATYGGVRKGATLTVLPLLVSSLTCTPMIVTGGNPVGCTVSLTDSVAPGYHANVTFSSSNPAVATVPWGLSFSGGQNSASFVVTTKPVTSSTPVTISASWGVTKTATLRVNPVRPASLSGDLVGGLTAFSLPGRPPDVSVGMGDVIRLRVNKSRAIPSNGVKSRARIAAKTAATLGTA